MKDLIMTAFCLFHPIPNGSVCFYNSGLLRTVMASDRNEGVWFT